MARALTFLRNFRPGRVLVLGVAMVWMAGGTAWAQRPFVIHDPFYRSESSERDFFGGYAITAELSYREDGSAQTEGFQSLQASSLGLSFRVDYQLSSQLDLSAIVNAGGNSIRRSLALSWVVLKYYERSDDSSFALRLAVDPTVDGRAGFPQMDLAWLSSSPVSQSLTTDFALGVRRVRLGYEKLLFSNEGAIAGGFTNHMDDPPSLIGVDRDVAFIFTRALGWELHLMLGYNFRFDPVGSNVFVSVLGQTGSYDLLESAFQGGSLTEKLVNNDVRLNQEPESNDYLGGIIWLRAGIEFNRPSFQLLPFIGIPLQQWIPSEGVWPTSEKLAGVRLMLR